MMQAPIKPQGTIQVKYFTRALLETINNDAAERNSTPVETPHVFSLDPTKKFPISGTETDDNGYVVTTFVINDEGDTLNIGLTYEEWEALPVKRITKSA